MKNFWGFDRWSYLLTFLIVWWVVTNGYLAFVAFWPDGVWPLRCFEVLTPVEVLGGKIENGLVVVRPGDTISYRIHFKKYTDKPALISRQILDDRIFNYADVPSNLPKGEDVVVSKILLPVEATPNAPHTLVWSATYRNVIPFRDVTVRSISRPFMVRAKKVGKAAGKF